MKQWIEGLAAAAAMAAAVAAGADGDCLQRGRDGQGDVRHASFLGKDGKWSEGRAFVRSLRSRPQKGLTPEERQSADMAEFALLRHDMAKNRARCIECLKAVCDAGPRSFWGWAAWTFLTDLGVKAPMPEKDPLRGLGKFGDGVVNMVPARLSPGAKPTAKGAAAKMLAAETAKFDPAALAPRDLEPGSEKRRAVLRARLVRICGTDAIDAILGAEGGAALFARLWNDDAGLEDFLLSGPVPAPDQALETLMTLFLNDAKEGWSRTETGRRATVAAAINARKGDSIDDTVRHWAAFRRIGTSGRFVESAGRRDCREWRFIVRRPSDPADILYLNTTRKFPARYLRNVGLKGVPYRKRNCFATSKWARNDEFLRPWTASGLPRQYLRSRVGGVCTEQAMWAALCANAHGLMAERAGQPGHCCWLLRGEDGDWKIIAGVRPHTAGVFSLWGSGFQYIQSTELAFADRRRHDVSELLLFAGRPRDAAMYCPYNWTAWRAWTDSLKARNASAEEWREYIGKLVELAPEWRLPAWDFAWEAVQALEERNVGADALAREVVRVFRGLPQPKRPIAEEMDYRKHALKRFLRPFRGNARLTMEILAAALDANKESPRYFPAIFGYAMERWAKDGRNLDAFFAMAAERIGSGGAKGGRIDWRRLCSMKGCLDDRASFRMMAGFRNAAEPPAGPASVPQTDYGASLASHDALVRISSSGKGDTPEDRARVSDATPYDPAREGLFATGTENDPWVIVELAGDVQIAGVTLSGDCTGLKLWTSVDGKDWSDAAVSGGDANGWRIDLRKAPPQAKYVKAGRPGGGKPLKLRKMLVYGNRLF